MTDAKLPTRDDGGIDVAKLKVVIRRGVAYFEWEIDGRGFRMRPEHLLPVVAAHERERCAALAREMGAFGVASQIDKMEP